MHFSMHFSMRFLHSSVKAGVAVTLLTAALAPAAQAQAPAPAPVGDIQAFYNAPNPFGVGIVDAPTFVFQNTSAAAITDGVFRIGLNGSATPDSFNVGTLAAGADFILTPGVQSDGGSGHTFFAPNGPLDTSDSGPSGDEVEFDFTGLQGSVVISSGIFTPGATAKESGDKTVPRINFLGGPGNADGPCNDCFDPTVVATLNPPAAVPEASQAVSLGLLLALGAILKMASLKMASLKMGGSSPRRAARSTENKAGGCPH